MKKAFVLLYLIVLMGHFSLFGFHVSGSSQFESQMKGIGMTFKQFGIGMAESFGMNPPGYNYSFRVFNNAQDAIIAKAQRIKEYQGMMIPRQILAQHEALQAGDTGKGNFNSIGLYLSVVIPGGNYPIINLMPAYKKNGDVYCYNTFQSGAGISNEFIGVNQTTCSDFLGSVYNDLSTSQTIKFTYAGQNYTVDLDPNSYNLLQSNSAIPNCIRPSSGSVYFDFGKAGSVVVSSDSLASKSSDGTITPYQYHYEIAEVNNKPFAYTAGFNPGNYYQATNQRMRNITPVQCLIWNKSAAQVIKENPKFATSLSIPVDQPRRSVWVAYGWKDASGTMVDPFIANIPLGQALQFWFIRPSVDAYDKLTTTELLGTTNLKPSPSFAAQTTLKTLGVELSPVDLFTSIPTIGEKTSKACLYVASLNIDATQITEAKAFMTKLLSGEITIPKTQSLATFMQDVNELQTTVTAKTANDKNTDLSNQVYKEITETVKSMILSERLVENQGELVDSDSNVSGYLLIYDVFTPYGNGSGPYFYTLSPAYVSVSATVEMLKEYINESLYATAADEADLTKDVGSWITTAFLQPTLEMALQKTYQTVTAYLQKNGKDVIFEFDKSGKRDRTQFNWSGNMGVNFLVSTPGGVLNIPLQWFSGISNFVYTNTSIPYQSTAPGKSTTVWTPDKTVDSSGQPAKYAPSASSSTATTS